ncbi:MAG: lysyl endopeptidase [Dysgonamonadaceae bacterium]|jgi:hypothetical protein|nr:lysyl endopeptidase [Dysgonamonadaceae bacterium]
MNRLFFKLTLATVSVFAFNAGNVLQAQISHGGIPLFDTSSSSLRSTGNNDFFIEMPSFNVDSLLREDELNESNIRGSFRFAHKFHVNIEKGKTGNNYTLPDGTKVWQVGIRSQGAYSINVFFSEYKLPQGGKLFLYNSDKTYIIGSFTHENNSEDNILPIQPVAGDEIIVEYQEPANSEFEAKLKIIEVNHDYRGFLRSEPGTEPQSPPSEVQRFACMPDVLCVDPENDNIRSVVLVIINGTTACSGTLLNTTNNDGEPVLLTAVHCLDQSLNPNTDYANLAGTIVCFFNYRKPVCNQTVSVIQRMKGTQEMSLAGTTLLSVALKNDMALLRFRDVPPDYYQPYYAGWNVNANAGTNAPFVNIHHPNFLVARYGSANTNLTLQSYATELFNPGSHWRVSSWSVGSTDFGSSGSPLFDNQGLLVGGLTGGSSLCSNKASDYFFALHKSWEYTPDFGNLLQHVLDPKDLKVKQWEGYDPYKENPLFRLKNGDYNNGDELVNSKMTDPEDLGLVFGNNSLGTKEFAEEFSTEKNVELVGVYLLTPPTSITAPSPITIKAYKETLSEENLVASEIFYPTYLDYDKSSGAFTEKVKTMSAVATESFVKFQKEKNVGTKFYVSYEITYPLIKRDFSVYNMIFDSPERNSAWLCDATGNWLPATEHPVMPISAGLTIEPLVRNASPDTIFPPVQNRSQIIYSRETQQLKINTDDPNEKGTILIYSITGQLLDKISYQGDTPVDLSPIGRDHIVVVKVLSEKEVRRGKIIL